MVETRKKDRVSYKQADEDASIDGDSFDEMMDTDEEREERPRKEAKVQRSKIEKTSNSSSPPLT